MRGGKELELIKSIMKGYEGNELEGRKKEGGATFEFGAVGRWGGNQEPVDGMFPVEGTALWRKKLIRG